MIPALLLISKEKFWYKISLISLSPQIAALSFLHVKCTTRSNRQQIKSQYISVFPLICKSFCIMPSSKLFTSIILRVLDRFCWGSKGIQCILEVNNQNFIHVFICPLFLKLAEALLVLCHAYRKCGNAPCPWDPKGQKSPTLGELIPDPSGSRCGSSHGEPQAQPLHSSSQGLQLQLGMDNLPLEGSLEHQPWLSKDLKWSETERSYLPVSEFDIYVIMPICDISFKSRMVADQLNLFLKTDLNLTGIRWTLLTVS